MKQLETKDIKLRLARTLEKAWSLGTVYRIDSNDPGVAQLFPALEIILRELGRNRYPEWSRAIWPAVWAAHIGVHFCDDSKARAEILTKGVLLVRSSGKGYDAPYGAFMRRFGSGLMTVMSWQAHTPQWTAGVHRIGTASLALAVAIEIHREWYGSPQLPRE